MSCAEVAMLLTKAQEDPEMKRMCQVWEAKNVAGAIRGTLHNRLTNGTRKYGQIFLGELDMTLDGELIIICRVLLSRRMAMADGSGRSVG